MSFSFQKVEFSYSEKKVLQDLSLELEPGRFYGVIGPNGSGKTTFLDLILGYQKPVSGQVFYKNRNLQDYGKKELAKEVALVPQDYSLNFPFKVQDIVLMGRYPHLPRFSAPTSLDWQKVQEVLDQTGIIPLRSRFIHELSGGEKQRVVFARALVQDTPVLLLDEATSSLDVKFGLQLLKLAKERNRQKGVTIVSVFHDLNQAACFCDHLLFFKQGCLVEHGPLENSLNRETLQNVFEVQAKVYFEPFLGCPQVVMKEKSQTPV